MNNLLCTDIATIHDTILKAVKNHFSDSFGQLETVSEYDPFDTKPINTPAVLLSVESMSLAAKDGSERTGIMLDLSLTGILSKRTPRVNIEIRVLAAELLRLVDNVGLHHWGLESACTVPENISASPANFSPEKGGFESWAITWSQVFYISNQTDDKTFLPESVYVGLDPNIGPEFESDYHEISNSENLK